MATPQVKLFDSKFLLPLAIGAGAVAVAYTFFGPKSTSSSTTNDSDEFDVVVVGSANIDLIAYVPRLPKPGETLNGDKFETGFGGKGANQCVMAAKLGAKTAMVCKIGTDSFGTDTLKNFEDVGVNTDHVTTTSEAATGCAPIAVDHAGENSIVVVLGANDKLTKIDVANATGVITRSKVLLCQNEIPMSTTIAALQVAKDNGVLSIFNPAPAPKDELSSVAYSLPSVFCVNETESQDFTGIEVNDEKSAEESSKVLMSRGCNAVLTTMGAKGSMLMTKNADNTFSVTTQPCPKVKATDTSGAGDSYLGAFAFFLSQQVSMAEAMRLAGHIASVSVQNKGTQKSYPSRNDLPASLFE